MNGLIALGAGIAALTGIGGGIGIGIATGKATEAINKSFSRHITKGLSPSSSCIRLNRVSNVKIWSCIQKDIIS